MAGTMKYVTLDECKNCKNHKGQQKNDYVRCQRGERIVTALIGPANQIPKIKNGTSVVRCPDVPNDPEVQKRIDAVSKTAKH